MRARIVPPSRCNAPATCIAHGGYSACDAHREPEGFASLDERDRPGMRCDYPTDGLGAAGMLPMYKRVQAAKREARAVLRDSHGLNSGHVAELAYSPAFGTFGMRWSAHVGDDSRPFRVFQTDWPMHGRSDEVTDWVSVGRARAAKG